MNNYDTIRGIIEELIFPEIGNTIYMLFFASVFSLLSGVLVAVVLSITDKNGLMPNAFIFTVTEVAVDLLMSMPFIVLAVAVMPLTSVLVGTSIGKTAALVPLTIATTPIFAKFIYEALQEVNAYLIMAAKSFGASKLQITVIMLKEAVPAIISSTTLSCITTLNSVSMMGAVGAEE